jgi:hypothetical protein
MGLRGIKTKARLDLHAAMQVPARYFLGAQPYLPCGVRVHTDDKALGDVKGTAFEYAARHEVTPHLIFLISEIRPTRGALVAVEPGEVYAVDNVLPPDGITVTAEVTKVRADAPELAGISYPGDP